MHELLKQAVLIDTETLGLGRGAGIHELAVLDLQTRHLREFILDPNAVAVQAATAQERTGLAAAWADVYRRRFHGGTWGDVLADHVQDQLASKHRTGVLEQDLRRASPWLAEHLQHYPHLTGRTEDVTARKEAFRARGLTFSTERTSIENALEQLRTAIAGRTVWIANAPFESKQIGAVLGAAGPEVADRFKSTLETRNPASPEPFHVTGSEVQRARALAQIDGDWTHVWRAYKRYTPAAGETAVRDIQDVLRAMHSYGHKLGYTNVPRPYLGTAIDTASRFLASSAGLQFPAELHRAAEDVGVHELFVLQKSVEYTEALQAVHEGRGQELLAQARRGEGVLAGARAYFRSLEAAAPALERENVLKRVLRAREDIETQGYTYQTTGWNQFKQEQLDPQDRPVTVARTAPTRRRVTSMEKVLDHIAHDYQQDVRAIASEIQDMDLLSARTYVHEQSKAIRGSLGGLGPQAGRYTSRLRTRGLGAPMAAAVAVLGAGALLAGAASTRASSERSVLSYGYDEWAEQQRIEGMDQRGLQARSRKRDTDFGSPYKGPTGVEQVFIDQELLRERERALRAQYGAIHYDPAAGVLSPFGVSPGGYSYIGAGTAVRGADYGLRGNLMALDLSNGSWKIEAEDADTVVVKRGGVRGAVASFFGLNRGYSFRLAGIDSPETSHGAQSWHAPQPGAEDAANALKLMLAGSTNQTLVFDPQERTYGRMLGAVIADGRNLNFELVRRGQAAHLPYGKASQAMIDYGALEEAEARAYQTNRGIWAQPWSRAFYEYSAAAGNRTTFNTLAKKSKIVENVGTMKMVSMMEQAQAQGASSPQIAGHLGSQYSMGNDLPGAHAMVAPASPASSYMSEQLADLAEWNRTKGGRVAYKHRASNVRRQNSTLVLDSLGTSNNHWTRRRAAAFTQYGTRGYRGARAHEQARAQRLALQSMGQSPINHHRM